MEPYQPQSYEQLKKGARNIRLPKQMVNFSKSLSKVLRHQAQNEGIEIQPDGFCRLDDILESKYCRGFKATMADVIAVVEDNNKKRFELKRNEDFPDLWLIRAVQGHSISAVKDEELLEPLKPTIDDEGFNCFMFPQVIHGTYYDPLKLILENGLCRMTRNGVHMAIGLPGDQQVISGMRNSAQVIVEVNVSQAVIGGEVPFFISPQNKVILSPGVGEKGFVPAQFIRAVFDIKSRDLLHQAPIDYLCVYDFECNCSKDKSELNFNEIIEFPCVVLDLKQNQVVGEFHTYVRPTLDKHLPAFCTELTGITEDMVFGKTPEEGQSIPTIEEALKQLHKFLAGLDIFKHEFVFASCGDFDGRQMKREGKRKDIKFANYLKRWINLKNVFPPQAHLPKDPANCADEQFSEWSAQWTKYGQVEAQKKPNISGMEEMLSALNMELEGRHHSGIDDTRNLVRIVQYLLKGGFKFNQAMVLNEYTREQ